MTPEEAEAELGPAIEYAITEFLKAVRTGVLGSRSVTAAAADNRLPDLNAFPDDSVWRRLVDQYVRPAFERVHTAAYTARRPAPDQPARDPAEGLFQRLAAFPVQVFDRIRDAIRDRPADEPTRSLRRRLSALMTLEEWDNATTAMTRTEVQQALNAGALSSAFDAQDETRDVYVKRWIATNDARTRQSHRDADGQTRLLTEPFDVGGARLQFPGDPMGPPEEVINCRCAQAVEPQAR